VEVSSAHRLSYISGYCAPESRLPILSKLSIVALLLSALASACAGAAELHVAVAANFLGTLRQLQPRFEAATGHQLKLTSGSSGQLYAQIRQGAPFDVLLSADTERPEQLVRDGLAVPDSRFTYASGRLALWSAKPGVIDDKGEFLNRGRYRLLAMANPQTAPYGAAARQLLERLKLWDGLQARRQIVTGESIAQAMQFATSGSVDAAFVSLAQIAGAAKPAGGSWWLPPQELYAPIRQDAVLLSRSVHRGAATQLLQWLRTDVSVRQSLQAAGYRTLP
jgi:molybdate transport system substrate-binding protein